MNYHTILHDIFPHEKNAGNTCVFNIPLNSFTGQRIYFTMCWVNQATLKWW
jgi:hypothetical protein